MSGENHVEVSQLSWLRLWLTSPEPVPCVTLDPAEANITILDDDSKKNYVA